MSIVCSQPLDDRIVVFGQSCVGKTEFAKQLTDHHYHCFDALFCWHEIEGLGLSASANLAQVRSCCHEPRFVLDGWHLSDGAGAFLPLDACVYVIYAPYSQIVDQYRAPVSNPRDFWPMYCRWYREINYQLLPGVRYFRNEGDFVERTWEDFISCTARNQ